jgi:L-arabinose isomerase
MNLLQATTYALSFTRLPVLRRAKVPVVVLNLCPERPIDYDSFNMNNRCHFPIGARAFVNHWNSHGPTHHCAFGFAHIAGNLTKFVALLDTLIEKIC